jgi:hypothetical protein
MAFAVVVAGLVPAHSSAAAATNPCTLLTDAQVAKAIGSKVASKQIVTPEGGKGSKTCQWSGVNLSSANTYAIHRSLMITAAEISRAQFLKFANESQSAVRVNGIGQIAFRQGNGAITFLNVWQNGHSLEVIAGEVTNPLAAEKTAARAALAHL